MWECISGIGVAMIVLLAIAALLGTMFAVLLVSINKYYDKENDDD